MSNKVVKHLVVGALGAGLTVYMGSMLTAQLGFAGSWASFVAGTVLIAGASWIAERFQG